MWEGTTTGGFLTVTVNGTRLESDDSLGPGGSSGFFGVIDTTPFPSFVPATEMPSQFAESFQVDDFQLAPEPGTLALLATAGLLGLRTASGRGVKHPDGLSAHEPDCRG